MAEQVDTLSKYGQSFQAKVISALLTDVRMMDTLCEIIDKKFFESDANKWIVQEIKDYYDEYKKEPTLDVFKGQVSKLDNPSLKKAVVEQLKTVYTQIGQDDFEYVKNEFTSFCINQNMKNVILQSVDLLKSGNYDRIKDLVDKAMKVGVESDLGMDYIDNFESIMEDVKRFSVSTGWDVIDELTDGGLGPGELGVVMAPSGIGKSWFLSKIACSAVQQGMNVLHYTLELSESYVGQRYTTILTGIQTSEHKERKEEIVRKIKNTPGRVRIKYYPPQFASSKTLSAHIEKLKASGFNPNLIIIDYADLLKSSSNRDGLYAELGGIYEELRGLSGETGIPIWTATQTNRAAIDHEIIGADSVGDSYKKVQTADFIMSVSRKTKDKLSNTGRIHIVKNRFGPDGLTFPAKIDTFTGTMDIFAAASIDGMASTRDSKSGEGLEKKLLHKKYVENMG